MSTAISRRMLLPVLASGCSRRDSRVHLVVGGTHRPRVHTDDARPTTRRVRSQGARCRSKIPELDPKLCRPCSAEATDRGRILRSHHPDGRGWSGSESLRIIDTISWRRAGRVPRRREAHPNNPGPEGANVGVTAPGSSSHFFLNTCSRTMASRRMTSVSFRWAAAAAVSLRLKTAKWMPEYVRTRSDISFPACSGSSHIKGTERLRECRGYSAHLSTHRRSCMRKPIGYPQTLNRTEGGHSDGTDASMDSTALRRARLPIECPRHSERTAAIPKLSKHRKRCTRPMESCAPGSGGSQGRAFDVAREGSSRQRRYRVDVHKRFSSADKPRLQVPAGLCAGCTRRMLSYQARGDHQESGEGPPNSTP